MYLLQRWMCNVVSVICARCRYGYVADKIRCRILIVVGTGFGINPQVLINGKMCVVSMFTDSHISCSVAVSEELGIGEQPSR